MRRLQNLCRIRTKKPVFLYFLHRRRAYTRDTTSFHPLLTERTSSGLLRFPDYCSFHSQHPFLSLTLSAITGGTCRSLTLTTFTARLRQTDLPSCLCCPGSVRCSEAIFHVFQLHSSQQSASFALSRGRMTGMFSVKHRSRVLSSSLRLLSCLLKHSLAHEN